LHTETPDGWDRFGRELLIQAELASAGGFVPILTSGCDEDGYWFAMPLLREGTLRDRLKGGPIRREEFARIATTVSQALGRAHSRGFVHRDIKPENLLYDHHGEILIADMGIARFVKGDRELGFSRSLSATGEVRGTIGYLAPECIAESKHADARADVFSFGCVLYECLAGQAPYTGATSLEILANLAGGEYAPLEEHRPDLPLALREVIETCLASDPERRYRDGAALGEALSAALGAKAEEPAAQPKSRLREFLPGLVLAFGVGGALSWAQSRWDEASLAPSAEPPVASPRRTLAPGGSQGAGSPSPTTPSPGPSPAPSFERWPAPSPWPSSSPAPRREGRPVEEVAQLLSLGRLAPPLFALQEEGKALLQILPEGGVGIQSKDQAPLIACPPRPAQGRLKVVARASAPTQGGLLTGVYYGDPKQGPYVLVVVEGQSRVGVVYGDPDGVKRGTHLKGRFKVATLGIEEGKDSLYVLLNGVRIGVGDRKIPQAQGGVYVQGAGEAALWDFKLEGLLFEERRR
tara:strand:- start:188 stop:1753 length:1566 start_codon:yes stop_codon:yes gene_type:complete